MPKRPTTSTTPTVPDRVPPTDEWGIYDPAKAGMQALYAKLGRPVIRASSKKLRQERRRGFRPERTNDGVGLAIQEAMERAGVLAATGEADAPIVPVSPARAVRLALKAAKPSKVEVFAEVEAPPPPVVEGPAPVVEVAPRRKPVRRAKAAEVVAAPTTPAVEVQAVAVPARVEATSTTATVAAEPAAKAARAPRKTAKARTKSAPAPDVIAAPAPPVPPAPPAPSPRRPRGPVPLAAWARAVTDTVKVPPPRADKRGFWRAIFRMPAEVALVEYAHGCRIHRLLIETSDDAAIPDLL